VTKSSKLVSVIILENKDQLVTLDSDYLMRIWSLSTGKQVTTLLLKAKSKKKLTCATVDMKEKHLAISDEEGQITIHNLHSAGVLHTL
jgi:WD40 repeat protein